MDYLPGALDFEAGADGVDPALAGRVLWFDALVGNVDRSWRNPNMLFWHGRLQLIDHGAALTFHHPWPGAAAAVERPYDAAAHALIECEPDVPAADAALASRVTRPVLEEVLAHVPDDWLGRGPRHGPGAVRRPAARPAGGTRRLDAGTDRRRRDGRRGPPPRAAGREPAGMAGAATAGRGHAAMRNGSLRGRR